MPSITGAFAFVVFLGHVLLAASISATLDMRCEAPDDACKSVLDKTSALLQIGHRVTPRAADAAAQPAAKPATRRVAKSPTALLNKSLRHPTAATKRVAKRVGSAAAKKAGQGPHLNKQAHASFASVSRPRPSTLAQVARRAGLANIKGQARTLQAVENLVTGVVHQLGGVIVRPISFRNFVESFAAEESKPLVATAVARDLRALALEQGSWVSMPPSERGSVQWKMIRPDPWHCDLLLPNDDRHSSCNLGPDSDELNPHKLTCGKSLTCNVEHANSFRTLTQIGSLPCCNTSPFCSAPACNKEPVEASTATCTKRKPEDNVAYMKQEDTWPAYHGWGGSFELDTLKLLDALSCKGADCPEHTFDLALDLGANTGYYTEKLTTRDFAKNYVLVEANPAFATDLKNRWESSEWKDKWFSEQTTNLGETWKKEARQNGDTEEKDRRTVPEFVVFHQAISNNTEGELDMCVTEASLQFFGGCKVGITSIDKLIAGSDVFKSKVKDAQSAFIKIDTEGMDELVLRGMRGLLDEKRGQHEDGSDKYLVNFLQFEFAPLLMKLAKGRENFANYDIKTVTQFLESVGFESFLIGPRFLPLSHGSYKADFKTWTENPSNNAGVRLNYPKFDDQVCPWCQTMDEPSFTADVFAIRASHPRAAEIKVALGACKESKDFNVNDETYDLKQDS